ncbi:MAG: gephyrin-like molybdotransferase Glp [Chloroflexota bacterium]
MTAVEEMVARPLLSLEEARARMLDGLEPLDTEEVALEEADGRVLANVLASKLTLPPFDNSAMDGFAVIAAGVAAASKDAPVSLTVIGEAAAGRRASVAVTPGNAVRILTGAPLPEGADAVVPVEDTDARLVVADLPERVSIKAAKSASAHIRRAGSDMRRGDVILAAGTALSPQALTVAAAGGHAHVNIYRRPRVALLSTGDELVPVGDDLGEAQIPDSNTIGLAAQARELGADVRSLGIARDTRSDVLDRLRQGLAWADVIVASGGVSVGAHDVVKDAFAEVGRIDLWRIAVQPGKPLVFGRAAAPGKQREVLLFGLPGNPVSSFVTFELFVRPVLRCMAGHSDVIGRQVVRATLEQDVTKGPGRRAFLRVTLTDTGNGWRASLAGGQDSHVLSTLVAADGLAIIPEERDALSAGSVVEVIRIR